jgi:hypothetical protein
MMIQRDLRDSSSCSGSPTSELEAVLTCSKLEEAGGRVNGFLPRVGIDGGSMTLSVSYSHYDVERETNGSVVLVQGHMHET